MKKYLANIILIFVSLAIGFAICEVALRFYLYKKDIDRKFDLVISTYLQAPGSKGVRYEFDIENNLEFKADVSFNNWGYRSKHDWSTEKGRKEFRIAIFGDSYTENVTNDYSWVDVLQDELEKNNKLLSNLGKDRITVANFGRSGAGFQTFETEYLRIREQFQPDLTIFAFIDEDFKRVPRNLRGNYSTIPVPAKFFEPNDKSTNLEKFFRLPGFGGDLYAIPAGNDVFNRALYYAGSDDSLILNKDKLRDAKKFLSEFVARNRYLKSKSCEFCKLFLTTVESRFSIFQGHKSDQSNPSELFLQAAFESIDVVRPEPLILLNLPAYYEVINQLNKMGPIRPPVYFPEMALKRPQLKIIALGDFLPKTATYEEKYSWFTLPFDGHPSNKGVDLYGKTISKLLADYLLINKTGKDENYYMFLKAERSQELISIGNSGAELAIKEGKANQLIEAARKKRSEKLYKEALELFTQTIDLAPHIGMPGLLYIERGEIYQALERYQEALDDYERAIAINSEPSFITRHLAVATAMGKSDLVASDMKKLEACCKNSAEYKNLKNKEIGSSRKD
jgi:tetratricopeptide (TPR) repeat protein